MAENFRNSLIKQIHEILAIFIGNIPWLLYYKSIKQCAVNRLESTFIFTVAGTDIFKSRLAVCPSVRLGNTLGCLQQNGQHTRPASRALVLWCGLLYFSAISSGIFCVSIHCWLGIKPSCLPTEIVHYETGFANIICIDFEKIKVLSESSNFS